MKPNFKMFFWSLFKIACLLAILYGELLTFVIAIDHCLDEKMKQEKPLLTALLIGIAVSGLFFFKMIDREGERIREF